MQSIAASIASQPPSERARLLKGLDPEYLPHLWRFWARPDQLAPDGDWRTWMLLAGRGAGKTRAGAEWVRERVKTGAGRIGLIAPTAADARDVMVSALKECCHEKDADWQGTSLGLPLYEPSKRRVTWNNGAFAMLFSADEPDRLRGPQHDTIWADELAAWNRLQEAWDMAQFGLRLRDRAGRAPRQCVTTTPRPLPLIRRLVSDPRSVVSRASTYDNAANLAEDFIAEMKAKYEGTRLGRQEIAAEILDDVPGALWTRDMIEAARIDAAPAEFDRVVIGVDPSGSDGESGDSQGIIVAARKAETAFVLEDGSARLSPEGWARVVADLFGKHAADTTVAEKNFGGDMVRAVLQAGSKNLPVKLVNASRGKHVRAEPIARLYEQGKVKHCAPMPELEDQLTSMTGSGYAGDGSPDRADALVWALTELMLGDEAQTAVLLTRRHR